MASTRRTGSRGSARALPLTTTLPVATDILYTAAEERAHIARTAGLQAKRDEQPKNTMRSYASKQKQWREWCLTPRPGPDGVLSAWPDGELVTPDKLAAWLSEDLLLRRVAIKGQRPTKQPVPHNTNTSLASPEESSLSKAEALAETLHIPLAEAIQILCDDQAGYEPPDDVDAEEGAPLTRTTLDAYVAAVMELWRLQVAHGSRNLENPRSSAVRGFLEQRTRQRSRIDRTAFKDRGSEGIQAGYSSIEWSAIQKHLLSTSANLPQNFRTRVDLLFGHYYLLRGENRRKMELADLSLLEYPLTEGPTPCRCLVALLQDGKMNKTAKKEFMGALRHKDPLLCTQGALAQLLFWRWHIAGEPAPTFRHRQDWYNIKVLIGSDRMQELSYRTQLEETWRVFGAVGLTAEKKTHLPRRAGAQEAETHGTTLTQISQAGRWNTSILCKAYLTHLPRQFMRIVAGFSGTAGDYFLTRAVHEPPDTLQKQLWPWIEAWEQRFEARARRKRWIEGGLDNDDLAGDGFLKLLRHLRVVLLQDLAALQPQFPKLPFFSYAPFRGPDWAAFATSVQARIDDPEEPASLLVKRVLPELYSLVESTRSAILQNTHQLHGRLASELASQLARQQQQLDRLFSTQIIMTGYLGGGIAPSATGLAPEPTPCLHNLPAQLATAPPPAEELAAASGIPIVSCFPKVYTVADVWHEWKKGVAGGPAIESLEEQYGHRWRPGNTMTVQFCRRKVVWDALKTLIARGRSEGEAIRELEALRGGQSINKLVDRLRQRRQRQRHRQKQ
ncbi:hypothetical protein QBC37DRAFT_415804 [Rhypophila decipiens]|uniref:Transcription activator GCR1-like domain-containing protein n=1 Tax=Rhypophila decipiens TaxID=261697 RepID=A0AAN7BAX1_9PEZI|nr:hypothetical protein QBC37DRAFT_415804 [Rhypophila decipiens]